MAVEKNEKKTDGKIEKNRFFFQAFKTRISKESRAKDYAAKSFLRSVVGVVSISLQLCFKIWLNFNNHCGTWRKNWMTYSTS